MAQAELFLKNPTLYRSECPSFYLLLKKLVCVLVMVGLYTYIEFFSPRPTPQKVGSLISLEAVRSLD